VLPVDSSLHVKAASIAYVIERTNARARVDFYNKVWKGMGMGYDDGFC